MSFSWLEDDPDVTYMRLALTEAEMAASDGEVPVGAVAVHPDAGIVGRAHNEKERLHDATAHAEILVLGQAANALQSWRLEGVTVYTTLEPCPMCAGAIVQARVARVVYGARDPKAGAVESVVELWQPGLFNHDVVWRSGVLEEECGAILTRFFKKRRNRARIVDPNEGE